MPDPGSFRRREGDLLERRPGHDGAWRRVFDTWTEGGVLAGAWFWRRAR